MFSLKAIAKSNKAVIEEVSSSLGLTLGHLAVLVDVNSGRRVLCSLEATVRVSFDTKRAENDH